MSTPSLTTRFAPSPTGLLHLGNARTALFNFLLARHEQGRFILRSEDTDRERSREEFLARLCDELRWLGLDWDLGPDTDREYRQSERNEIYRHYFEAIERAGLSYPCFCTPQELKIARSAQIQAGQAPRYRGTCRELSAEQRKKWLSEGRRPSLRFRVLAGRTVEFIDLVRGMQRFQTDDIGDFVIRRSDGTAAFFFSNAIDDALMNVTHVLRGEDHLANTPRQILLLEALDLEVPRYAHLALLVGDDGAPLSKRHGSLGLAELRERGYLPDAVTNYLARLGHTYEQDGWLSLTELARGFSIERLGRSSAHFDEIQLRHWQKLAVARLEVEAFCQWIGISDPSLSEATRQNFVELVRPNVVFPSDGQAWFAIVFDPGYQLHDTERPNADPVFLAAALGAYKENGPDLGAIASSLSDSLGVKGKRLYMPLREALTGRADGPELAQLLPLMPAEVVRRRLDPISS